LTFSKKAVRYVTIHEKAMGRRRQLKHMKSLTDREPQIILTLAESGLSNRDVGRRISLSEGTIKVHLHNIYKNLGGNEALRNAHGPE
jgi:ATP/maltotriose-dependent transcriptional regulator MalT